MQNMQHFTERELDILYYFYKNKRSHVREIKRETKISEHTLLKYLKKLKERELLSVDQSTYLKVYEVNLQHPLMKVIYAYFDIEKLSSIEHKRVKATEDFILALKKIKLPYFVLLFGSTAKGIYAKESDIDVLVAYERIDKRLLQQIHEIEKKIRAERGFNVNTITITLHEFLKEKTHKENYALQDALRTGYPIFGHQTFYEVML